MKKDTLIAFVLGVSTNYTQAELWDMTLSELEAIAEAEGQAAAEYVGRNGAP